MVGCQPFLSATFGVRRTQKRRHVVIERDLEGALIGQGTPARVVAGRIRTLVDRTRYAIPVPKLSLRPIAAGGVRSAHLPTTCQVIAALSTSADTVRTKTTGPERTILVGVETHADTVIDTHLIGKTWECGEPATPPHAKVFVLLIETVADGIETSEVRAKLHIPIVIGFAAEFTTAPSRTS